MVNLLAKLIKFDRLPTLLTVLILAITGGDALRASPQV